MNRVVTVHDWTPRERAEYDSLHLHGRALYNDLRSCYDALHADAFKVALAEYGRHVETVRPTKRRRSRWTWFRAR